MSAIEHRAVHLWALQRFLTFVRKNKMNRRSVSVCSCLSLCEWTARGWLHLCVRDYLCANKEHVCRFEWTHKWAMSILCVPRSECKPKLTGLCFAEGVGVEGVWQACLSPSSLLGSAKGARVCLVTTLVPKTKQAAVCTGSVTNQFTCINPPPPIPSP